jgi:UDP-N-acetylmuramyl tripeptide synthase
MELLDSHRLTGPNLIQDLPGAALEVAVAAPGEAPVIVAWRERARAVLDALGWSQHTLTERHYKGGASLAFSAPHDSLYAACEANEWAWGAAVAQVRGEIFESLDVATVRLAAVIALEADPKRCALHDAASLHGVQFLADDEFVTIGSGAGGHSFAVDDLPAVDTIDWRAVHDVPTVLVTGTNGKSTTVRLLASMAAHAGHVVGTCSTDRVQVGDDVVEAGDYSGPEGARRVLRDRRTTIAFLETARGGLLRRGLSIGRADVAIVLNVAADHLGEGGVDDVETLTRVKLLVSRAVGEGHLVLCADDPWLAPHIASNRLDDDRELPPVTLFSLHPEAPSVCAAMARGASTCVLDGSQLVIRSDGQCRVIADVQDVPATFGGTARFNVHNALAAIAAATALGIDPAAITAGLQSFVSSPEDNPGRGNRFDIGGVQVIVDFAHNAHSVSALADMVTTLPSSRRLVLLGQAGDRSDESVRDLVRATLQFRPDLIIVKRMRELLRGRDENAMVDLIEAELLALGTPSDAIMRSNSELEAVHAALAWARPGDLLLLLSHSQRADVLALMQRLQSEQA